MTYVVPNEMYVVPEGSSFRGSEGPLLLMKTIFGFRLLKWNLLVELKEFFKKDRSLAYIPNCFFKLETINLIIYSILQFLKTYWNTTTQNIPNCHVINQLFYREKPVNAFLWGEIWTGKIEALSKY